MGRPFTFTVVGSRRRSEGTVVKRVVRLFAVVTVALAAVVAASAGPATADAPPQYFVDETKLPFAAIPGIDTDRFWDVHNGAGYG